MAGLKVSGPAGRWHGPLGHQAVVSDARMDLDEILGGGQKGVFVCMLHIVKSHHLLTWTRQQFMMYSVTSTSKHEMGSSAGSFASLRWTYSTSFFSACFCETLSSSTPKLTHIFV